MAAVQEDYATTLRNIHATRYLSAAGFVVLLYDHLLTIGDEVRYVWPGKMNVSKALFLFNRYLVPTVMMVSAYQDSGLSARVLSVTHNIADNSPSCKTWLAAGLCLGSLCLANANLLLRLWVLWNRRRKLVLWTLVGFIVTHLVNFGAVTWAVVEIQSIVRSDPLYPVCVIKPYSMLRPMMAGLWIPGVVFECMIFVTAWWNAMSYPRAADELLSKSLCRDGVSYFVVLLGLRVMNLVLAIFAPLSLTLLGLYFVFSMTNVTFSRLVLNLRRIASEARAHHSDHSSGRSEADSYTQTKRAGTFQSVGRGRIITMGTREESI